MHLSKQGLSCVMPQTLSKAAAVQVDLDSDTDVAPSLPQAAAVRAPQELDPLIGVRVERFWSGGFGWCPGIVSDFRPSSGLHW